MSTKWCNHRFHLRRNPKLIWGSLFAAGGVVYLKVWLPLTNLGIPCVFREATGLYCPGCGMTRAAVSLLEADVQQAFRYNPLLFIIAPMLLAHTLASRGGLRRTSQAILFAAVTAAVAFGVLRNVPAWAWLAPTTLGS